MSLINENCATIVLIKGNENLESNTSIPNQDDIYGFITLNIDSTYSNLLNTISKITKIKNPVSCRFYVMNNQLNIPNIPIYQNIKCSNVLLDTKNIFYMAKNFYQNIQQSEPDIDMFRLYIQEEISTVDVTTNSHRVSFGAIIETVIMELRHHNNGIDILNQLRHKRNSRGRLTMRIFKKNNRK